jgi:hypothetical protein
MKKIAVPATLAILLASAQVVIAAEVKGHVLVQPSNCPLPNLVVEIDPTKGSAQPKVITTTGIDGGFSASLMDGRYLLVVFQQTAKVYQGQIQVNGTTTIANILLSAISGAPSACSGGSSSTPQRLSLREFEKSGARPSDLALDGDDSLLVLDSQGGVLKIVKSSEGLKPLNLFSLKPHFTPASIASDSSHVMVTANGVGGCALYLYEKSSRNVSIKLLGQNRCTAIATDEENTYTTFGKGEQVDVWNDRNFATSSSWPILGISVPTTMAYDLISHELFVGDATGKIYLVSQSVRARKILETSGTINSIGLGQKYLVVVGDGQISCFARVNFAKTRGNCLGVRLKGTFTGVRVDASQNAWFIDARSNELVGPYAIQ